VYNGVKAKIANDEELAKQLQNSDLNPKDKQNMLKELALTVMQELGYVSNDVKLVYTDETGVNNTQVKGYFDDKTNTSYVNDKYNDSTTQLIASLGHEITHDMDKQDNIYVSNDKDQNIYATNFGEDLAFYTNGALNVIKGGSLANTNNHNNGIVTTMPSIFNNSNNMLNLNNQEFASLDKSGGDDYGVSGALIGGGLTLASQVLPELAMQYYLEDKSLLEIDYLKVYNKVDFIDIGTMAVVGAITPVELSAGSSAKNILNSVDKYKKYNDLALKTNKNLNKKDRFETKAKTNKNNIGSEILIQTGILGVKTGLKEIDDAIIKGDE
jgi:hypothetical protein